MDILAYKKNGKKPLFLQTKTVWIYCVVCGHKL